MLNQVIKQVPLVGQVYEFAITAMKVYNLMSPIDVIEVTAQSIIEDCAPRQVKYPVKCSILLVQVELAISS